VVEGLDIGESGTFQTCEFELLSPTRTVYDEEEVNEAMREARQNTPPPAQAGTSTAAMRDAGPNYPITTKKRRLATEKNVLLDEKWIAQTELLKQQAYNIKLQNFKMEIELGLPHNELTSALANLD